jgi:hypothetical protein
VVSGYLRPRFTDKQAVLVFRQLQRGLDELPGRSLEAAMLRRACVAILDAEAKRALRQAYAEDLERSAPVERRRGWRRWMRRTA